VPPPADCGDPVGSKLYVSPTGDDANSGTEALPWKTLQKAASSAQAGDTVYLMPGTWAEPLVPKTSGAEGKYITYAAQSETARPVIDGATLGTLDGGLVQLESVNYVRLCNLVVINSKKHGVVAGAADHLALIGLSVEHSGKAGIYFEGVKNSSIEKSQSRDSISSGIGVWYSSQIAVRGNKVIDALNSLTDASQESLTISGTSDFEVADNEVYLDKGVKEEVGNAAIKAKESSQRGKIHHNHVHDFYPEGHISLDAWEAGLDGTPTLNTIEIYANRIVDSGGIRVSSEQRGTVENVAIYNNLILHTDNGIIISDAGEGGPRKDIRIYNNTVYEGSHDWFDGIYVLTPEVEGIVIRNNIVVSQIHVGKILAMSSAVAAKITADHNLVFGPTGCLENHPQCVELSELAGNTTADPMFVNALAGDLHLRAGSPAIDQGIAMPGLADDLEGVVRPQGAGVDIGALEFQGQ